MIEPTADGSAASAADGHHLLSAIVREGLQCLHSEHISPELAKKVISNAVKQALHSSKSKSLVYSLYMANN